VTRIGNLKTFERELSKRYIIKHSANIRRQT